jgi:hypothetical protein
MISPSDMSMYNKMTKKQLIKEIRRFDDFIDFMCDRQVSYPLHPPYYIKEEGWPYIVYPYCSNSNMTGVTNDKSNT